MANSRQPKPTSMKRIIMIAIALFVIVEADYAQMKQEFRAVWIATVANIDWPSRSGLTTQAQKDEFIRILDYHKMNGFNAVIVQVRPSADAFYESDLEPWSKWLTGVQGTAPDPYYDPLAFMIDAAHERNLEFHAWFNPYRVVTDADSLPEDSTHIIYQHADWFLKYGNKIYFDPGIPEARAHVNAVIKDVTNRYDIDAVHFDDYFYPYKIAGEAFPDTLSFAQYCGEFTADRIDDWRRHNVDTIIKMLNDSIKHIKPHVKFGISPFGVWRNKADDLLGSDTEAGQTNYDDLYADILKWIDERWIDYVLPQVYWHIGFEPAAYEVLIHWWSHHAQGVHLYIGQAPYRISEQSKHPAWQTSGELISQLTLNRKYPKIRGSAYFSSKSLINNPQGITDHLRNNNYRYPALIPPMEWLDGEAPDQPVMFKARSEKGGVYLHWEMADIAKNKDISYFVVYRARGKKLESIDNPCYILETVNGASAFYIDRSARSRKKYTYAVTAVDRLHNESKPVFFTLKHKR